MEPTPFELNGFEPVRLLGGGGFGDVWLARQTNIDRDVAIKVGHAPIGDKTVQMRFERECIALGRLSGHPNIIDVFTAGQLADGRPYLVLEFVAGGTLWDRFQQGPVPEPVLRTIGIQLSDALAVAHTAGVLHRDLKPENVLLRPNGEAVLGDFGIARLHDGANTTSHAITASVAYAAPEILSGQPASVASDIYGIGVCLLASVLRAVPFVQKTDESIHPIINRVLSETPPDLRTQGLSPQLSAIIARTLDKDPAKRPASAAELKSLLEGIDAPSASTQAAPPVSDAAGPTRAFGSFPPPTTGAPGVSGPPGSPAPHHPSPPHPNPGHSMPGQPTPAHAGHAPLPPGYGGPQSGPTGTGPAPLGFAGAGQAGTGYQTAGGPPPGIGPSKGGSNRALVFAAAFGGTVLVGGLLLWAVINAVSGADDPDDISATQSSTDESTDDESVSESGSGDTTASGEPGTEDTVDEASTGPEDTLPSGPLVLPLTITDIGFSSNATSEPDLVGPASAQFCDNVPSTTGLNEWLGETITDAAGTPIFFQEIIRFQTVEQANSFVDSYVGTIDCEQWTLPTDDPGIELLASPSLDTPTTVWSDDTRALVLDGQASGIEFFSWFRIVRHSTDVLLVNLTGFNRADVEDLDRVVGIAVGRLGY